jgi:hypothetical protein
MNLKVNAKIRTKWRPIYPKELSDLAMEMVLNQGTLMEELFGIKMDASDDLFTKCHFIPVTAVKGNFSAYILDSSQVLTKITSFVFL